MRSSVCACAVEFAFAQQSLRLRNDLGYLIGEEYKSIFFNLRRPTVQANRNIYARTNVDETDLG